MRLEVLQHLLSAWVQPERDGLARESAQSAGSTYLRERLSVIAERCAREWPGDLVEIGVLNGSTTIRLAAVARLHGRRVIAVDPFTPGSQNISADAREYGIFLETIKPYADVIDFLKKDSRDPEVAEYLKARELCFAFVDGLHEFDAALSDIRACYHAALICVDDLNWNSDVKKAFDEGAGERLRIELPPLHEGYIL